MKKIIIPFIVIVIFIVLVVWGVKGLPREEEGVSPSAEPEAGEPAALPEAGPVEGQDEALFGEMAEPEAEPQIPSWQNPETPMQSLPMEASEVPEEAVKITITAEGFSPASFEVKKGKKVMLAVTSGDEWTHIFRFKDESLAQVAVGIGPGQTRVITFFAPDKKGEYGFFCDVPGHEARGEKGKMIVK